MKKRDALNGSRLRCRQLLAGLWILLTCLKPVHGSHGSHLLPGFHPNGGYAVSGLPTSTSGIAAAGTSVTGSGAIWTSGFNSASGA